MSLGQGTATAGRSADRPVRHGVGRRSDEMDVDDPPEDEVDEEDEEDEEELENDEDEDDEDDDDEEEEEDDDDGEEDEECRPQTPEERAAAREEKKRERERELLGLEQEELVALIMELEARVVSDRKSKNASNRRCDHHRVRTDEDGQPTQTEAQRKSRENRHARDCANFFRAELDRRCTSGMRVLNKVLLELSMEEREELRCKGFMQQEYYLCTKFMVDKLKQLVYNAENTLETRLSEYISVRAFRRMRRILTQVRNSVTGKWEHLVLMHPPKHRSIGGEDPPQVRTLMS